jgi:hypothetical protein
MKKFFKYFIVVIVILFISFILYKNGDLNISLGGHTSGMYTTRFNYMNHDYIKFKDDISDEFVIIHDPDCKVCELKIKKK